MRARSQTMTTAAGSDDESSAASSPPASLVAAAMAGGMPPQMPPGHEGSGRSGADTPLSGPSPPGGDEFKVLQDPELANLLMAWYYSGYYTGRYQAQREARESDSRVSTGAGGDDAGRRSGGADAGVSSGGTV